ncbi:glycosyltransferase [Subsaximicrobium wynnwilliamsii]|uniref:Glycosyltransferase n=1 Tax=Subsaximicrobium wynnwilliamsii TaxID=291179 RepID=A0A5C6ZMX8_9FLAO|nr:glycosyltransferase [Subsaximicrobium wynnwilliamsii]TXD85156.1 glycosyltransferase [Subsaximicrobium wynnwilliamsii]TXD91199.1 glycosyltransferase [Subsaximicrobium wynnwilliamsii]TXE04593.1 glycosyltransferase [Subsaximicrobium wynnwilliamsii]
MVSLDFSFIIPVYNRAEEVEELLRSFVNLQGDAAFEIVIVEDGSTMDCKTVISNFETSLNISYYQKPNSGPGDSRNFGMRKAKGNYFIILDSDCILPSDYLIKVTQSLNHRFVDCYGGPDAAHHSFTNLQKAINFTMTSLVTTGGIRGGNAALKNFQPRSFNMGLSKAAFLASGGFGSIHPGEDPDLSIRLNTLGYETALFPKAFVYHKRRLSWSKFYKQVYKFGLVRPILNTWHPKTAKWSYWLPSAFSLGFLAAVILMLFGYWLPIMVYVVYVMTAFILALINSKSLSVAFQSILAIFIQFFGYGLGFLKSSFAIKVMKQAPQSRFPNLFFDNVH